MPKKSSKKGSKKRTPAAETTLVPHRASNLIDLLELAKRGKLSDVQQYLSAGGSANVLVEVLIQPEFGSRDLAHVPQPPKQLGLVPLLSSVAGSRHSDAAASIKLLLQAGAAVDVTSRNTLWKRTALMVSCSASCNLQAVQALLEGGADPCLQVAASYGYTDVCNALHAASAGRALELTGKYDNLAATRLIAACAAEQYAVVELLCALGVDENHSSVTGNTPVMIAAEAQDTSILQLLLQQDGIEVNHRNHNGDTAFMKAAGNGNVAAVKLLLQHG
jgi:ankyrin repeat protein